VGPVAVFRAASGRESAASTLSVIAWIASRLARRDRKQEGPECR
jgi:hypothetical protein